MVIIGAGVIVITKDLLSSTELSQGLAAIAFIVRVTEPLKISLFEGK